MRLILRDRIACFDRNIAAHHLLNFCTRDEAFMITPVLHRKWAREFLVRAEQAPTHARKCRYLKLAVSNTMCAQQLESEDEMTVEGNERPAPKGPTSNR